MPSILIASVAASFSLHLVRVEAEYSDDSNRTTVRISVEKNVLEVNKSYEGAHSEGVKPFATSRALNASEVSDVEKMLRRKELAASKNVAGAKNVDSPKRVESYSLDFLIGGKRVRFSCVSEHSQIGKSKPPPELCHALDRLTNDLVTLAAPAPSGSE